VSDSTIVIEAEELQVRTPGWRALPYGTNYYAATLANTFLSREAYLGAPEQGPSTVASVEFVVPRTGRYLALARYEAAYRFETRFRMRIEQGGQTVLDRPYGAREALKVWAFRGLARDVTQPWGGADAIVWEGTDAYVDLQEGTARLTLEAGDQPEPAAKRDVDVVVLTSDTKAVEERLSRKDYLPLDGILTQAGDVFLRVRNHAGAFTLVVPPGTEHSPYWVHVRGWKPKTVQVGPHEETGWIEAGSLLDTLSDGQWTLEASGAGGGGDVSFELEVGVPDEDGRITTIRSVPGHAGKLRLAYFGDTRYSRHLRTSAEVLDHVLDYLRARPVGGAAPLRTPIYGTAFDPSLGDAEYAAKVDEFVRLVGANRLMTFPPELPRYVDVRGVPDEKLASYCGEIGARMDPATVDVVSMGDEIALPSLRDDPKATRSALEALKRRTTFLHGCFPNAGIGANFSPHARPLYLGTTYQWITPFREGALTMPWGEDYVFQVPVGSPQVNSLVLDIFRAGLRGKPQGRIQYYVMPHDPGNTPNAWRRQFYGDIAHGAKVLNLFEIRPVQAAYSENHVDAPEMVQAIRVALHELGGFEDIVQDGQARPAPAALWFSEAADLWDDKRAPFDAHERALYLLVRHQQVPLDVVVEGDDLAPYRAIYLTDRHVSRAASRALARWVERGGQLVATAGAGMFDEADRPNEVLRALFGVEPAALEEDPAGPVALEKQDLPFARPMDHAHTANGRIIPVLSLRAPVSAKQAQVVATFDDGRPAATSRAVGSGTARYVGFLPALSYLQPAIPRRPFDRRSDDEAMCHLLPTVFDEGAADVMRVEVERPVIASVPLVETMVLEAKEGMLIPLINWTGHPVEALRVTLRIPSPSGEARLATGRPLRRESVGGEAVYTLDLDVADALVLR
jgi:hypothetical protein